MHFLNDIGLSVRLYLGYGLVLVLMLLLVFIGVRDVSLINGNLTEINDLNSVKQRYAINFRGSVHDRAIAVRDLVLLTDPAQLDETRAEIAKLTEDYAVSARAMDDLIASDPDMMEQEEQRILDSIKQIEAATLPLVTAILSDVDQGDLERANERLLTQARPNFVIWLARINEFIDREEAKNIALTDKTRAITSEFQVQMIIVTVIAVLIGVGAALWIILAVRPLKALTQSILALKDGDLEISIPTVTSKNEVGQITTALTVFRDNAQENKRIQEAFEAEKQANETARQSQEAAEREAAEREAFRTRETAEQQAGIVEAMGKGLAALVQGNLSHRIETPFPDFAARLREDFNDAMARLSTVVSNIAETAGSVQTATSEISTGTSDLSGRTEQQAASLEETAAAMEELTVTVKRNAEHATEANILSDSARLSAEKGGTIVQEAVTAMTHISASSKKVTEIVGVMDEIAFQTNLLALNAAVEAARAGDAGKGFAVVASEVRALAQRSSTASKEIGSLIQTSVAQINDGVEQVNKTGQTLEEIVASVQKVAAIVATISDASKEQATGLQEVNTAVSSMDQMTQQNAALVEETTSASHSLKVQADNLTDLIAHFTAQEDAA